MDFQLPPIKQLLRTDSKLPSINSFMNNTHNDAKDLEAAYALIDLHRTKQLLAPATFNNSTWTRQFGSTHASTSWKNDHQNYGEHFQCSECPKEQNKMLNENKVDTISLNESFKSCDNESLVSINDENSGVEIGKSNSIMVPKPQEYRADTLQRKPTLHQSAPDLSDRSSIDTVATSIDPADEPIEIISLSPVLLVSEDYNSFARNTKKPVKRTHWYHNTLLVSSVVVGGLIVLGIVFYFVLPQIPKLESSDLYYTLTDSDIIPAYVQLNSGYLPPSYIQNIQTRPRNTVVSTVPFNITKAHLNGTFNIAADGQFSPLSWMGVNPSLKSSGIIKPSPT
ncbi:hypothetical protein HDV06_000166 [Boothiomyces sp. JEL0866]|nr:hypothetical protein HDV06_000166 [Boothiomyces sp. JEL0866]